MHGKEQPWTESHGITTVWLRIVVLLVQNVRYKKDKVEDSGYIICACLVLERKT